MKSNLRFAVLVLSGFCTVFSAGQAKAQPANYRYSSHPLGGFAGYCPPTKMTGSKPINAKSPVITVGSPVIDLNIAIISQNGVSNTALVQQGNLGRVGSGNSNGLTAPRTSVSTIGSPVINVNIASVTQTGLNNIAVVNQSNLGQIGIFNSGFINQ